MSGDQAFALAQLPDPGELRIGVIVLTINQCEQTLRCLEHLENQECLGKVSILVWDNGSRDGTADAVAAKFPDITYRYSEANLGVAGGRNAAAAAAIGDFSPQLLLFLDNDMVVCDGFIAGLAQPFLDDRAGVIGQTQAKLRLADDPERLNDGGGCRLQFWLGRTRPVGFGEVDSGQRDTPTPCISCGGAMMVRTELFQHLGGFDEAFNPFGPEDLDFSLRLQEAGYEAWYRPAAMAYHDVNHTFGAGSFSEDYARHRARHWLRLMRRHAGLLDWLGFILVGAPAIGLRVLFREGRKRNLAALRGLVSGVLSRR
jgi:GT2 family glycosyltransferase